MNDDPVEIDDWLRSRDPLDPAQVALTPQQTDEVLERIRRRVDSNRHRRVASVAAAVAVVVCAAAAYVVSRPATDPTTVACHASLSPNAGVAVIPVGSGPVSACREARGNPAFAEVFPGASVPTLMACVTDDGEAQVYPADGEDPCNRLGLDRLSDASPEAAAIQIFETATGKAMLARCVALSDAKQIVLDELVKAGLDDWTVAFSPDHEGSGCGSIAIDPRRRIVRLILIPPPPTN